MKINIKRLILPTMAAFLLAGCSDWVSPENVKIGNTNLISPEKDDAYYQALREYKASEHEISFGWFSRWDEPALTTDGMLRGIPDSMDVVSLWSNSRGLSPERMEDLRFVQKVKGTKVLICTFCQYIGKNFTPAEHDGSEEAREAFWGWKDGDDTAIKASIEKYAKAISDTVAFYGYDGLDVDFEPNIDGVSGKLDENSEYATYLFNELSKYFGPKSGTGRLFLIDGEIYNLNPELCTCFDYFVSQAYTVSGGSPSASATGNESNMDYRLSQMVNLFAGKMTEEEVTNKFVVTENMESALDALNGGFFWRTRDGVVQDKKEMPSLLGMAMWQPANGFRKGGFGGYRFGNEAVNNPPYKWMRKGIQARNSSSGVNKILVRYSDNAEYSFESKKNYFGVFPSESIEVEFGLLFTGIAPKDEVFMITHEPSLASQLGLYKKVGDERVVISSEGKLPVAAGAVTTDKVKISVDLKDLEFGDYAVPVKVSFPEGSVYYSDKEMVRYIKISRKDFEPILVTVSETEQQISAVMQANGSFDTPTVEGSFTVNMAENAPESLSFNLAYDASLVDSYNALNNQTFATIDASNISVTENVEIAADTQVSNSASITISTDNLQKGEYLVPVRVILPEGAPLRSDGEIVHYLKVSVGQNIVSIVDALSGSVKIEPTDAWQFDTYNGYNLSGWNGVWNLGSDEAKKGMLDGKLYGESNYFWYSVSSYFNPGNVVVGMDKVNRINGFRWHYAYGSAYDDFYFKDVQISNDRENWKTISYQIEMKPTFSSGASWINLQLSEPVEAKYFRLIVGANNYVSMDECEIYGPTE